MTEDNVTAIDDLAAIEREAQAEVNKEVNEKAKRRIKDSLREIKDAERILANLKIQHRALLDDLRSER